MKLKSLNRYIGLLIFTISFSTLLAEEQIDIWNKKEKSKNSEISLSDKSENEDSNSSINSKVFNTKKVNNNIQIENTILNNSEDIKIFGIYDPAENDFNLNMWALTNADDVRSSLKRINKINLSNTSKKLFERTFFSFAYPPQGMDEKEFIDLKINWMINNQRSDLIEKFLKQNNTFHNKKKVVQYLVDENIAKANIKKSCEKVNFLDKNIKDSYLEKFKIYCLVL
ncbi:MAG: hypothetical protein CBD13_003060, partial [Candidatus Pelagibacter sp. TMED153]